MKILKIKDWLVQKTVGHFRILSKYEDGDIHSVERLSDKTFFITGDIKLNGFVGSNHYITSFNEDLINVNIAYTLHNRTIYWPNIDINSLPPQHSK